MRQYTYKGLYNAYKKNNSEREEKDCYATPTAEVLNILRTTNYDFSNQILLEPCVDGGHMAEAILQYLEEKGQKPAALLASDV